jgi:hypothetical protein
MKPLYIFDLDGTLALIEHRRHFVESEKPSEENPHPYKKPDWKAFYAACVDDLPNVPVIRTLKILAEADVDVWVFSGRSDEVREETEAWLERWTSMSPWTTALQMRKEGDYTPDDKLKKQWLDSMLDIDRERLVAIFEDRDRMVKMWRDNGIACFQVAPGEF